IVLLRITPTTRASSAEITSFFYRTASSGRLTYHVILAVPPFAAISRFRPPSFRSLPGSRSSPILLKHSHWSIQISSTPGNLMCLLALWAHRCASRVRQCCASTISLGMAASRYKSRTRRHREGALLVTGRLLHCLTLASRTVDSCGSSRRVILSFSSRSFLNAQTTLTSGCSHRREPTWE